MSLKHPILLLLIPAISACDSQVDGNYNGPPLARLEGTVRNMRTLGCEGAEVAILWADRSGGSNLLAGDPVEVESEFPGTFRFSLYAPPDDMMIRSYPDGSRIGIAYIVSGAALHVETSLTSLDNIFGMDLDHLLAYLPADVVADSHVFTLLRGASRAGFHLYEVHHLTEGESLSRRACEVDPLHADWTFQALYEECDGSSSSDDLLPLTTDLETPLQIDLVDDPREQDVPIHPFNHPVSPN